MQALSVYNDHAFKQIVLLLLLERSREIGDQQGWALALFAAPFLIFANSAGVWSDRVPRRRILLVAKYAEAAIMLAAGCALMAMESVSILILLALLFLMAAQSTYLGPAKYGILLDLFPREQITRVNAMMQTLAYGAIVAGAATGGGLVTYAAAWPWLPGTLLVGVAALGVLATHQIPSVPLAKNMEPHLAPPRWEVWHFIRQDRLLRDTLCVFGAVWLLAGLYQPIVNSLGRTQLGLSALQTSLLLSLSVVGIASGCLIRGRRLEPAADPIDLKPCILMLLGLQILLALAPWLGWTLRAEVLAVVLLLCGGLIGMVILPLHVSIQVRPPPRLRGRVLAAQNVINWLAIILAGATYQVFRLAAEAFELLPSSMFLPLSLATAVCWWMIRPGPGKLLRRMAW